MSADRLFAAVELFNAGEFFACHDALEELWSETLTADRTFYQGLIHAAVALHHFEGGNLGGARKMYFSARRYLEPFGPVHAGLDLAAFLGSLQVCCADLVQATEATCAAVRWQPKLTPQLRRQTDE